MLSNKENKILIHIGYFRTASTWLQRHLFSKPEYGFELLSNGRDR